MPKSKDSRTLTIRDLYPNLSEAGQKEAEENLRAYLEHELRVFERICGDPKAYKRFRALTAARKDSMMAEKGRTLLENQITPSP